MRQSFPFRVGVVAVAVVLFAALLAGSASAARTHDFIGTVGAAGELTRPSGLAVDSKTGNLYVADSGAEAVRRYTPKGAPAPFTGAGNKNVIAGLAIPPESQTPIAVDNSTGAKAGDFYVVSGATVEAFKPNGAAAAFADQSSYVEGNSIVGNPNEPFSSVGCVGVDSNGYVYVYNAGFAEVAIYTPGGEYVTQTLTTGVLGFALDPKGSLYAGAPSIESVTRLVPSEYPIRPSGYLQPAGGLPIITTGVATNARNGEFFADLGDELEEYTPLTYEEGRSGGNAAVTSFGSDQLIEGDGKAIAVDGSTGVAAGDVYAVVGAAVDRFGPLVKAPDAVASPATAVTPESARLNGTVNPLGEPVVECVFEYGLGRLPDRTAPCVETAGQIGAGNGPVAVHADVGGLEVADYRFRLRAAGPHGSIASPSIPLMVGGPPAVEGGESAEPLRSEATLRAVLRSGNQASSYHFDYGLTPAYGSSSASGTLAGSLGAEAVAIGIVGLTSGATYHYRVVVTNPDGTAAGPDQTFTTSVLAGAGSCPNEALRVGLSANLPECRAYELVSPVDKEGGEVARAFAAQPAVDGGGVAYLANTAFPGAIANTLLSTYASTRSADGSSWSTLNTDAPTYNEESVIETTNIAYDADLDRGLWVSLKALAPGAVAGATNVYLHDFRTGATETIAYAPEGRKIFEYSEQSRVYAGGTPDWSTVYLRTLVPLTGDAAGTEGDELYSWTDGRLRLISRSGEGQTAAPQGVDHVRVAADGRSLVYLSSPDNALYYTEADGRTRLISHPHTGGAAVEAEARPVGGTAMIDRDGSIVWFEASEGLVSGEPERSFGGQTLYRWERAGDRLTEIAPPVNATEGPGLSGVVGTSEDGSYVYFGAAAALAPGATPAIQGTNIYGWHDGRFEFIGQTEEGTNEPGPPIGQVLISPDGRYYAFGSASHLTPDEVRSTACGVYGGEPCKDVFVFDFAGGKLVCASCDGRGGSESIVAGAFNPSAPVFSAQEISAVFDDGSVYIQTPNALSPEDTNGQVDVYRWRPDGTRLISTGTSGTPSYYAGASADQRDVFIKTQQSLVAVDTDGRDDVYDARVGGGIASQNATTVAESCQGEACRGPVPGPPARTAASPGPRAGSCGPIAEAAAASKRRVAKLKRSLHRASGSQAKKLRHRIGAQRAQARRLGRRVGACRRAAR